MNMLSPTERYADEDAPPPKPGPKLKPKFVPTREEIERFGMQFVEQRAIAAAMTYAGHNQTKAAKLLGLDRKTLQRKLGR